MKPTRVVTSTDYAHPRRPRVAQLYNRARSLAPPAELSVPALLAAACAAAGAADFGEDSFREPLAVLVDSLNREARLNPLGLAIMRGRLTALLENRLRIEALIAARPAIAALPIRRPLVIAGLQRTGTTLLHRLLCADPRARGLLSWEALAPTPLPWEGEGGSIRRRAAGKLAELGLKTLAPEFFAIHPVEAEAPEEDVLLLDLAFMSQAPEATLHVPTYARWLEEHDSLPAYRYLKRALQVLTYQRARDHWVLKTPHHMEFLGALLAVFPDAVIVQTHRDPQATMGSFCSMVAHGRGVFSDEIDPREVGRHWLRKVRRMIDRSVAVREGGHGARFVDVSYYDLVKDPLAQVRRIYDHAGLGLTDDALAAMTELLRREVKDRHGRHIYRASDFGLSPALIEETFADYRARFSIPRERKAEGVPEAPAQPTGVGHAGLVSAVTTAVIDMLSMQPGVLPLLPSYRIDGQTALITGANVGLGRAIAVDLARRGARLILACRSGIPEVGDAIARESGSSQVEMMRVDLSDYDSVVALADELGARGERLDIVICNAGLMPPRAQANKHGHEVMYAVHCFANFILLGRLLRAGVIPNCVFAASGAGRQGSAIPRIVIVASEAHRSSAGLDLAHLGALVPYGVRDGLQHYGHSKLASVTFATELARRLNTAAGPSVAVHSLCPGPVATQIARGAPAFLKPVLSPVMRTFFASPEAAAAPVVYLAAAPDVAGETGLYMHRLQRKTASALAIDPERGRRLWERAEEILGAWVDWAPR